MQPLSHRQRLHRVSRPLHLEFYIQVAHYWWCTFPVWHSWAGQGWLMPHSYVSICVNLTREQYDWTKSWLGVLTWWDTPNRGRHVGRYFMINLIMLQYAATTTTTIILLEQIDVRCDRPLAVLCVLSSPVVWRLLYSLFIIMLSQELVLTKLYRIIFLDYGLSNVLTESCITIIILLFESQQSAILHVLLYSSCCGVIVW